MKKAVRIVSLIAALAALAARPVDAKCTKAACREQTKFLDGLTAFTIARDVTPSQQRQAAEEIRATGGIVALISDHVMLGWLEPTEYGKLQGRHGISDIRRSLLPHVDYKAGRRMGKSTSDVALTRFFNEVVSGRYTDNFDQYAERVIELGQDIQPAIAEGSAVSDGEKGKLKLTVAATTGNVNYAMVGYVSTDIFLLESNGAVDPNDFSWDSAEYDNVMNPLLFALGWWSNKASAYSRPLSFNTGIWADWDPFCQISYEPIRHASGDYVYWLREVLAKLDCNSLPYYSTTVCQPGGWPSPPSTFSVLQQAEAFNAYRAQRLGTNYHFITLVANNAGGPSRWPDYPTYSPIASAFAELGGPVTHLLYTNGSVPVSLINRVFIHETGHIFWACDEFSTACKTCAYCDSQGPAYDHGVTNANCDTPGTEPQFCFSGRSCIMWLADSPSYDNVCSTTAQQIGWFGR